MYLFDFNGGVARASVSVASGLRKGGRRRLIRRLPGEASPPPPPVQLVFSPSSSPLLLFFFLLPGALRPAQELKAAGIPGEDEIRGSEGRTSSCRDRVEARVPPPPPLFSSQRSDLSAG